MARQYVPTADERIDTPRKVLDLGEVVLIDYLGSDVRVVEAARTSYAGGTKTVREDEGLINYLMENEHMSPFEQVSLVWRLRLPLFVAVQLVRHRTAKLNSESGRYSVLKDDFYVPSEWRGQDQVNKQGSQGFITRVHQTAATAAFKAHMLMSYSLYEKLLEWGVARELARLVLPQNIYVTWYWKCDLRNALHMAGLRCDPHAQQEIRAFAEEMLADMRAVAPMCVAAWEEHHRYAVKFSRKEAQFLVNQLRNRPLAGVVEWFDYNMKAVKKFEDKLRRFLDA